MKRNKLALFAAVMSIILTGCGISAINEEDDSSSNLTEETAAVDGSDGEKTGSSSIVNVDAKTEETADKITTSDTQIMDISDMFSSRDYEVGYDETESAVITLNGDSAECTSKKVEISGSSVKITAEGTYILSGTLSDGSVTVEAGKDDKVQLVLDGVSVNSKTSAAIYILQADKVFITTAADSENTLSNGGEFIAVDDNNIDAVIYSKDDLTLNGQGSLTVNSPAGHGIVSKDDLRITSGDYEITSSSHGLSGKDCVKIAGGSFTITSGKDAVHSENSDDEALGYVFISGGTFVINSEGDAVSASGSLQIDGGDFTIKTADGSDSVTYTGKDDFMEHGNKSFWGSFFGNNDTSDGTAVSGAEAPDEPSEDMTPDMFSGNTPPDMADGGTMPDMPDGGTPPDMEDGGTMPDMPDGGFSPDMFTENTASDSSADDSVSAKGIKSSGDMVISGGSFNIDAADDCVHSNSNITINGGEFELSAGDDAIHADAEIIITDGVINIAKCYEGIEATYIQIDGGTISINSSDDGINSAEKVTDLDCSIVINGGDITIVMASGDTDALDSNGSIYVNGGNINITAQSSFDYETYGEMNGGTVYVNGELITEMPASMFGFGGGGRGGNMNGGNGMQGGSGRGGKQNTQTDQSSKT